jgi:uncharacterized membrane protein
MSRAPDALVDDYLRQLDAELADLPGSSRREVMDEISTHIREMRGELATEDELEIRQLLERLGDPAEIAADARVRFGVPDRKRTWIETTALILLSVGMIIPVIGWLVGVILLWLSNVWNTRDKVLGTLFAPAAWILFGWIALQTLGSTTSCVTAVDERGRVISHNCSGGSSNFASIFWPALVIALVLASIATMIYLALRLRRLTRRAVLA